MKKFILDFIHRGLIVCGGGPIVLAIVYTVLQKSGAAQTLDVHEVVLGILTSTLLAFIAGGINAIYAIERLPLIFAILIHGVVLYFDYVIIYLANDWLKSEPMPLLIFTGCFVACYAVIWIIIYLTTKKSADRLNKKLELHQRSVGRTAD